MSLSNNTPRPHWTTAPVRDTLPANIAVNTVGGILDLYVDTNEVECQRIRLTCDQAIRLYYQLAEHLPIRLKDTDQ